MTKKPFDSNRGTVVLWDYSFIFTSEETLHVPVCQKFLCNLINIKKGRFTTIQKKLLNNESLEDHRGTHNNRN